MNVSIDVRSCRGDFAPTRETDLVQSPEALQSCQLWNFVGLCRCLTSPTTQVAWVILTRIEVLLLPGHDKRRATQDCGQLNKYDGLDFELMIRTVCLLELKRKSWRKRRRTELRRDRR